MTNLAGPPRMARLERKWRIWSRHLRSPCTRTAYSDGSNRTPIHRHLTANSGNFGWFHTHYTGLCFLNSIIDGATTVLRHKTCFATVAPLVESICIFVVSAKVWFIFIVRSICCSNYYCTVRLAINYFDFHVKKIKFWSSLVLSLLRVPTTWR